MTVKEADKVMKLLGLEPLPRHHDGDILGWYINLATKLQGRNKALRELFEYGLRRFQETRKWIDAKPTDEEYHMGRSSGLNDILDPLESLLDQWKEKA